MYYNTIIPPPLSAERDNSRQLAGGNARARSSGGIITYNTFAVSCPRVPSSKLSGIIALSTQWRRYYSIIILGPDRNSRSGPVPVPVKFGLVPVPALYR